MGGPLPSAATGMGAWHAEWERPRGGFTNGTQTFLDVVHVFQEGEGERGGQAGWLPGQTVPGVTLDSLHCGPARLVAPTRLPRPHGPGLRQAI